MSEPIVRPRVLIVESDESVRRVLVRMLAPRFEVTPLGSGASAIGRLNEERFDLLIIDMSLSDMRAEQVVRVARARDARLPIIVTSASVVCEGTARELGAFACLAKPFHAAALRALVGQALAHG
ncbi:MAG: response regulator [Labilithrix sp.]